MKDKTTVPQSLIDLQKWFGSIICNPLQDDRTISPLTPNGNSIKEEAALYLNPSPTLKPHERIQIYNQQYWWRLIGILQSAFPCLLRILGYRIFNKAIAEPYLLDHPPTHWNIDLISANLAEWLISHYKKENAELIQQLAALDWAFCISFFIKENPAIEEKDLSLDAIEKFLTQTLYLQPYIHLFEFNSDLFSFREKLLQKEVPDCKKIILSGSEANQKHRFILYRNPDNLIYYKDLNEIEYYILSQLKSGSSIGDACDHLLQFDENAFQIIKDNISTWFQNWTLQGWLTKYPK